MVYVLYITFLITLLYRPIKKIYKSNKNEARIESGREIYRTNPSSVDKHLEGKFKDQ